MGEPDRPLKILFAPHEIGGQMQLMVEELRRRGHFATAATYSQEWFGHVNDIHLNIDSVRGRLKRQLLLLSFTLWAAQNYDVFHFFWGESLYGLGRFPHLDLWLLRRLGKKIFVHFRGLDVIDLAYFDYLRARTAGDNLPEPPINRPDQQRSLAHWRRYAHKMLVSEPDLLRVVPEALMVQQAIDLRYWKPERSAPQSQQDGIIRIAHAPSMRRKKGTEFVERSVSELKEQGYPVELVLIEKVPFDQVKALYEFCDIGVDQVLYGWYGKVSIELMALGRPVICYIDPAWFHYRTDMPIVNASTRDLTDRLRELVQDADLRKHLGKAGMAYVHRYHDIKIIVDQCLQLYQETKA
ncbi:MAG: glycosyltransferase family 4 protein [Anaerolineales bacterium]|nr:glycosyltransferase family 4 protein [Anaerolineales bacterium]